MFERLFLIILILVALFRCAGSETKKEVTFNQLTQDEQTQIANTTDDTLGDLYIVFETELNPALIEADINEITTARAPALTPEDDSSVSSQEDPTDEMEKEIDLSKTLEHSMNTERIEKIKSLENNLKDIRRLGNGYGKLVSSLFQLQNLGKCFEDKKIQPKTCEKFRQGEISSCTLEINGCSLDDNGYSVSGIIYVDYVTAQSGTIYYSLNLTNAKFEKNGKYVNFSGSILGKIIQGESEQEIKNINIEDTERGIILRIGSGLNRVELMSSGTAKAKSQFTNVYFKSATKEVWFNTDIEVNRDGKNLSISFSASATNTSGEKAEVSGVHNRVKSSDPKMVSREDRLNVSFSSPTTSFSASTYRYKSVKHEKTPDGKTFSLSITNDVKSNGQTIHSFSKDLTIVKSTNHVISGKSTILKKNGVKLEITYDNIEMEKGCKKPVGGKVTVIRTAPNEEKTKIEVTFKSGCVCEADVKVEKSDKIITTSRNMCEAGEKAKTNMMNRMGGDHGMM